MEHAGQGREVLSRKGRNFNASDVSATRPERQMRPAMVTCGLACNVRDRNGHRTYYPLDVRGGPRPGPSPQASYESP